MHVVLVVPWYPDAAGGWEGVFFREQARALAKAWTVSVVHAEARSLRQFRPGPVEGCNVSRDGDVLVARVWGYHWFPGWIDAYVARLARLIERGMSVALEEHGAVDVLHAHVLWPLATAALAVSRRHGVPLMVTEHAAPFSALVADARVRRRVIETAEAVDLLSAVSAGLANDMRLAGIERRPEILPNMVDTARFVPTPTPRGPARRILFVGALEERKGVRFLLEALSRMRPREPAVRLDLAGDGALRASLQMEAERLSIGPLCHFHGAIPNERLGPYFADSSLLVLPSRSESFGVVLLEALASGRPVVATRCGGPETWLTPDLGALVEFGDAASLAAALDDMLDHPETYPPERLHRRVSIAYGPETFRRRAGTLYELIAGRGSSAGPAGAG